MKILKFWFVFFAIFTFFTLSHAGDNQELSDFPDLLSDEYLDDEFDDFEAEQLIVINDPLEPMNRFFFEFNDILYEWALKPVTNGYIWLIPEELRVCFGNFFFNLSMPIRLLNSLLQGNFDDAGIVLSRFTINTTIGIYGFGDVAAMEFDLKPVRADFGQTLGKWGIGEGVYFCWPLVGPSSLRDSVGLLVDAYTHPIPYFHDSRALDLAYYTTNKLNRISLKPDLYEDLKRFSLDPYVASRQVYYEYRKAMIERD